MPAKPTTPKTGEIHGDQLEKLTGKTDRRMRQLAKAGWFPPPIRGCYQFSATIRGLLKYYEASADNSDWGVKKKEQEFRKLKTHNDRLDEKLIPLAWLQGRIGALASKVRGTLRQKLEVEYPNAAAGLDVRQCRVYGKRLVDQILSEFQSFGDVFKVVEEKKPVKKRAKK
jgi:hypothetical protein